MSDKQDSHAFFMSGSDVFVKNLFGGIERLQNTN